jgi:hypothetical protein
MQQNKVDPRTEYRHQEKARIGASPTLAERFQDLRSLEVDLQYFDPEALRRMGTIKYTVNLAHAKAAFSFDCPNTECVGGDFDLADTLATAVEEQRDSISGEVCCQGWVSRTMIGSKRCLHILRYTVALEYESEEE